MGFFSKNKNVGFIVNTDDDNSKKVSGDQHLAPYAITAEEVSASWVLGDDYSESSFSGSNSPLESLKKRMQNTDQEKASVANTVKEIVKEKEINPQETLKKEQPAEIKKSENTVVKQSANENSKEVLEASKSLLEKLQRYTVDDQGHDLSKSNQPLYKLESVAEILKSDSEKALKNLSKKYDVLFDDLGHSKTAEQPDDSPKIEIKEEKIADKISENASAPTEAFKQMVSDAEAREAQELIEHLFPYEKDNDTADISLPHISDIDNIDIGVNAKTTDATATIRFTPVKNNSGNTDHITISNTKMIDLSSESRIDPESEESQTELIESEFEQYKVQDEFTNIESGKKLLRNFAIKKRSGFLRVFVSVLSVLALLVFLIPSVHNFMIGHTKNALIICSLFFAVSFIANIDTLLNFKNLFKKECSSDILCFTASVFTTVLCAYCAFSNGGHENCYYLILTCAIILLIRAFCKFKEVSVMYGNLWQIITDKQKNAVTLIDDSATTFAMAKNSIEGDVLVAAHRKTNFIEDFVKYSKFSAVLSGKTHIVFYLTLILSLAGGIAAYFSYGNMLEALCSAAGVSCIAAMPILYFINTLPLASAAKKLHSNGSMISGMYAAEKIEQANAVVLSINDIFPKGTITMHNMKVLSDNNIDEILVRAASLTSAVNSPLANIFKEIAGTNDSYSIPDSDTVKYEKRLGISGWVDNELLFIGNRSLMEAHGIAIPSIEIDKKILRKGFFPVYVATHNTACALIVIQYDVDPKIAKHLHKLTSLGITLLIENCDPNVNEEMICNYFDIYEDYVKIMTNAGVYMCKNATRAVESCSAPAAFKGSTLNFIKIINYASSIRKSNKLLTVLYCIFAVFGVVYFMYASQLNFNMGILFNILIGEIIATVLSIIGFLIRKP